MHSNRLFLRICGDGLVRSSLFGGIWWAFTEGHWEDWGLAAVIVLLATAASFHVLPRRNFRWHLSGILRFLPYFFTQSLLGGLDVAWRALHPRMPIQTAFHQYSTNLPEGLSRVTLAWVVSLLPGTASVDLQTNTLTIHVLNDSPSFNQDMQRLERRIAGVFGIAVGACDDSTLGPQ